MKIGVLELLHGRVLDPASGAVQHNLLLHFIQTHMDKTVFFTTRTSDTYHLVIDEPLVHGDIAYVVEVNGAQSFMQAKSEQDPSQSHLLVVILIGKKGPVSTFLIFAGGRLLKETSALGIQSIEVLDQTYPL